MDAEVEEHRLWAGRAAPAPMARPHRHDAVEFNQLLSGRLTYRFGGFRTVVAPGALVLFWGSIPHRVVEVDPGTEFLCATVPLGTFLAWRLREEFVRDLLGGALFTGPTVPGMERWPADLIAQDPDLRRVVRLEMEAAVRRIAATGGPAPRVEPGPIERMAATVATRFAEPLAVADVAAVAGLHPATAMRRFREATGETIGDYLTGHRIAHACRLLASTDRAVASVARESGFGSESAFYEAFRRRTDLTPAAYRDKHRGR